MSTPTVEALAGSMKAQLDERPDQRLRDMLDDPGAKPVPFRLREDAFEIGVFQIEPDPAQPRKTFDEAELQDLAASIRENGLLQPILVYQTERPGRYRIVAGERRFRAAILAGMKRIPCVGIPGGFDRHFVDQLQLVENLQRADLRPVEAAEAIAGFVERHGLSQREAARRLGKPLTFVADLLAIRKIPAGLLSREGVEALPKQVLVEIGRAPASDQAGLLKTALAGSSVEEVRDRRSNREPRQRIVYFHERFPLEGHPPIEIRWSRHPEEVTDDELVKALDAVAKTVVDRHSLRPYELRTPG